MKYVIIDQKDGDIFTTECNTKEEALREADKQFSYLTAAEKESREAFYILESVNPDEDAEDHLDGNEIKNYLEQEYTMTEDEFKALAKELLNIDDVDTDGIDFDELDEEQAAVFLFAAAVEKRFPGDPFELVNDGTADEMRGIAAYADDIRDIDFDGYIDDLLGRIGYEED